MIAKKYRIPRENIPSILKNGESFDTSFFILRYRKNNEQFFRYRAIISRKIHLKAVKRNKLRRQIYEALRISHPPKTGQTKFDLILIPKKKILNAGFTEISQDVTEKILKKMNG